MDADAKFRDGARRVQAMRRQRALFGLVGMALALGCFSQKPSGESAPSAPAAPAGGASPAPPPSESFVEQKKEAPASKGAVPQSQGPSAAPPRAERSVAPAPAKPAAKARSTGSENAAGRAIGTEDEGAESDASALRQRLDGAYRAGSPDCPSARERKKAVCELATQICKLTDRDPNVASVAEYCSQAKQRCTRAEERTAERCPD